MAALLLAASAQEQVRPPRVVSLSIYGMQRGTSTSVILTGTSLRSADALIFSDPKIVARLRSIECMKGDPPEEPSDMAARLEAECTVTADVRAEGDLRPGKHWFRLRTALGTTGLLPWFVGTTPESVEAEPNDGLDSAPRLSIPAALNGTLHRIEDQDYYRINVNAAETIRIDLQDAASTANVDLMLELFNDAGTRFAENDDAFWYTRDSQLVFTAAQRGTYVIKVKEVGGVPRQRKIAYRLSVAVDTPARSAFPREGDAKMVEPSGRRWTNERPALSGSVNGQPVLPPVVIEGRIEQRRDGACEDSFRFRSRKGERWIVSVAAERLGSPLDAVVDVLDAHGRPIPRAILRAVSETTVDFSDMDSTSSSMRVFDNSTLRPGDHIFVDHELMQVSELVDRPEQNVRLVNFRDQRFSYEGTSAEAHAIGQPVYKVEIDPPATKESSGGLPLFALTYRNDDGGPWYGKDSYLEFVGPDDGEYVARIADARQQCGSSYAYRLRISSPEAGFTMYVEPANPNVPRGSRVPVRVLAHRHDGFNERIDVALTDLPPDLQATSGTILPGETSVALTITAGGEMATTSTPFGVRGQAQVDGVLVMRQANLGELVSIATPIAPCDLWIASVEPSAIELEPGARARVRVTIGRSASFTGPVAVDVLNLPSRVSVPDLNVSGILISQGQNARDFSIETAPGGAPLERDLYVTVRATGVCTVEQASLPLRLRVKSKESRTESSALPGVH